MHATVRECTSYGMIVIVDFHSLTFYNKLLPMEHIYILRAQCEALGRVLVVSTMHDCVVLRDGVVNIMIVLSR